MRRLTKEIETCSEVTKGRDEREIYHERGLIVRSMMYGKPMHDF